MKREAPYPMFVQVLRKWWSFDDNQRHTHSWHSREDFIEKHLPKLLDDVRQDGWQAGWEACDAASQQ